jgi:hypothetical protein
MKTKLMLNAKECINETNTDKLCRVLVHRRNAVGSDKRKRIQFRFPRAASAGEHYNPHTTIGWGNRPFLDQMKAEKFDTFTFQTSFAGDLSTGRIWNCSEKFVEFNP